MKPHPIAHDERWLRTGVISLCDQFSLTWHWCRDSRQCQGSPGMPDLVIIGRRMLLWVELKKDKFSTVKSGQTTWGHLLMSVGQHYRRWYVMDMESGLIGSELQQIAKP